MANPQQENGHTRIANELLEAILIYPFNAGEYKVMLKILRNTYGWSRKKAKLSYGEISRATGMSRKHAYRICQKFKRDSIIIIQENKSAICANILGINKNFEDWVLWKTCGKVSAPMDTTGDRVSPDRSIPMDTTGDTLWTPQGTPKYKTNLKQYNKTNLKQGRIIFKSDLKILFRKYRKDRYLVKQHLLKAGFSEEEVDNACLRFGFAQVVGGNIIYV